MQIAKNKTIAIAILLMLSMTASMTLLPSANAHTPPWQIPTFAFINVAPNPAGVGQTVTVGFWIQVPPPTAQAQFGDRWAGFTVKVTKPDGTTETLGPFTSDATGGTSTRYTPSQLGNYTFVFSFPGQTLAGNNLPPGATNPMIGDYYEPSTAKTTLTVQQEPISIIPENPLPTSYWTRPIYSVNDLWSTIGGNWLGLASSTFANTGQYNATGSYNPYTTAPTTAHILWTKPAAPGGQIGGEFGGDASTHFYAPAQYEPKFAPIILNGILYYDMYPGASSNPTGWAAVNLKTGQTLWEKNTTTADTLGPILKCGQTLYYVSPNQYGAFAYLWATGNPFGKPTLTGNMLTVPAAQQTVSNPGSYAPVTTSLTGTTYSMYDAVSGNYILSIVNGTGVTLAEDDHGDLIGYYVNSSTANAYHAPTLNMWNATLAIVLDQTGQYYGQTSANAWFWRPPQNGIIPFADGIQWTAPLATNISGVPLPALLAISSSCIENNVILMTANSAVSGSFQIGYYIEAGYSATTGQQLWITNRTQTPFTRTTYLPATAGVYATVNFDTFIVDGYSMTTGAHVWGPKSLPHPNPYSSIGGYRYVSANGICYFWGFGGEIYAIDMASGDFVWTTTTTQISGDPGANTPYGVWPLWSFSVGTVAGGMLFVPEGHQYSPPMFRGASQLAINITNGQPVWSILGFDITSAPAISDGVMTTLNSYDNQIYAYGKGPSKMTVTAPDVAATVGTTVVIRGTVTDISAGSQQEAVAANFPNGLPCVSDASMSHFMEAVYMQQPMPTNTTGVEVTLDAIDPNNNFVHLGTVTSDASGNFGYAWTPPDVPGKYQIIATFAGSESYYSSYAETYAVVSEAPPATPPPAYPQPIDYTWTIVGMGILLLIAIAIVGLLILRKRP